MIFSTTKVAQHGKFSQILGTWDLVACHIFMWRINLYFLQNRLARGNKNGTVLDLIVICEKKGAIKYSNKVDKFCLVAELCEFEVK